MKFDHIPEHLDLAKYPNQLVLIRYAGDDRFTYKMFIASLEKHIDVKSLESPTLYQAFQLDNNCFITRAITELKSIAPLFDFITLIDFKEYESYEFIDLTDVIHKIQRKQVTPELWRKLCDAYRTWYDIAEYRNLPFSNEKDMIIVGDNIYFRDSISDFYDNIKIDCSDTQDAITVSEASFATLGHYIHLSSTETECLFDFINDKTDSDSVFFSITRRFFENGGIISEFEDTEEKFKNMKQIDALCRICEESYEIAKAEGIACDPKRNEKMQNIIEYMDSIVTPFYFTCPICKTDNGNNASQLTAPIHCSKCGDIEQVDGIWKQKGDKQQISDDIECQFCHDVIKNGDPYMPEGTGFVCEKCIINGGDK